MPASGWRQRASTSNPVILPVLKVDLRLEEGHELLVLQAEADALLDLAVHEQRTFHGVVEPDGPHDAA